MELSKAIKIAYDLNDELLNPQKLEKTKVSLAAHIFGESTKKCIMKNLLTRTCYVKNGYPEWKGTLNFLKLIAKW